jgi:hypothetical protein
VIRPDGHGAIQLFRQHGPREGVRPGLGPEGKGRSGRRAHALVQSVGPADGEHQPPLAPVPQQGDMVGEGAAGKGLAAFVAGDQMRALGGLEDQFGLRRLAGFARFQIDQLERAKTEGPTGQGGALGIVGRQHGLGSPPRLADGDDGQLHGVRTSGSGDQARASTRWPLSTDQIFSML